MTHDTKALSERIDELVKIIKEIQVLAQAPEALARRLIIEKADEALQEQMKFNEGRK